MQNLNGKKLLILGGAPNEKELVLRAQKLGAYVIVADYHKDWNLSPAKGVANEAWDVSWADIDTLEHMCRVSGVDGVLAGYSELRVDSMIKLCARLNLPSYITMEQLEITRDKIKFKEECRKNGVPVVHEYATPQDVDKFPVIVKPVDRAGSIGISVATNPEELDKAYRYAMEMSICKQVIIEDFITNGVKFDVMYQIVDGEILLMSSNDVIFAKDNGYDRVVQSAWLLPSVHHESFISKVDGSMRNMLRSMGIQNGYIFFSGFSLPDEEFVFFECGFRLCGGHYYNYFYDLGGWNTQDLLIYYALTGSAAELPRGKAPASEPKCAIVNLYAKRGTISQITGLDELRQIPDCIQSLVSARIGQKCEDDTAILSKIGMAHFVNESAECLGNDVKRLYELVSTTDEKGNDMIYDRVDPEVVRNWWN